MANRPPPLPPGAPPIDLSDDAELIDDDAEVDALIDGIDDLILTDPDHIDTDLKSIFGMQKKLMEHFRRAGFTMPEYPLDLSQKEHQRLCRDTGLKAVEEYFEALQHLKNWKPHRRTEVPDFDREAFLEEYCDSWAYQLELLVFMGVTPEELVTAYERKLKIVHERIDSGY